MKDTKKPGAGGRKTFRDKTSGGDRPPRKPRDDRPEGAERSERPAGARSSAKFGKPAFDKPRADKPWSDKPRSDKPRSDKPRSDRPRSDEARSDKPRFDKPRFDKPRSDKPYSDRPRSDRPRADKPGFDRSGGDKPRNPDHLVVAGEGERISKIMARAGVASRRDCERMILEGRVSLNGKVLTTPAVNCQPSDHIEVDGNPIGAIERTRLWIYYKPAGLVTTNFDPEGRPTVFDNLPPELPRVISVGRLDINTEGLLLLTNDGGLARMLELPSTGWLRRYRVRAYGAIDQEKLDSLKEGIAVEGVLYGAIEATLDRAQGHNSWITMGLREGKNREIKNVLGALGLEVNRLIRISYGPFQLGELEEGQAVEVRSRTLRDQLGPRLIADANANFEAPIINQAQPEKVEEEPAEREARPRRESREERRERDLARIDTQPPRERKFDRDNKREDGERPAKGERGFEKKREPLRAGTRTANVWMAPGAKPLGPKKTKEAEVKARKRKAAELKAAESGDRDGKDGRFRKSAARPARSGDDRNGGGDRPNRPSGARPGNGSPKGGPKRGADRRR